ncbi:MAG: helix-turn-helix transcriptional regulator [Methanothrix sp.]|nr:helix-turn-helix transcriptional regulator [Methanothrix sp.]
MPYSKNGKTYNYPVEAALEVIGGKWKPLILWAIGDDVLRFSELQKALPGINTKMLTKQLRCLEEDGVILRTVYPEVPPHVEYRISDFGKTLVPILEALCKWGITIYAADYENQEAMHRIVIDYFIKFSEQRLESNTGNRLKYSRRALTEKIAGILNNM